MVNKKLLRLKCTQCRRLLQAEQFNHTATVLQNIDKLICLSCRQYCIQCSQLLPMTAFSAATRPSSTTLVGAAPTSRASLIGGHRTPVVSDATDVCDACLAKKHAAHSNVYFRYPVLKYKACPFPVEPYRDAIHAELSSASSFATTSHEEDESGERPPRLPSTFT